MQKYFFLILVGQLCCISPAISQSKMLLTESSFVVEPGQMQEACFGLAAGDEVIFSARVTKGTKLENIIVTEYPYSVRYSDYMTRRLHSKKIKIATTGVYAFAFVADTLETTTVSYKIVRIPANDSVRQFNTNVYWRTVMDTAYTEKKEYGIKKSDTTIVNLIDQTAKVHSRTNLNGSKTTIKFTLPQNTAAWSYYIGVDQEGQEEFEDATHMVAKYGGTVLKAIPGYGPLAALALGGVSYLTQLQTGEDIDYYIVSDGQESLFLDGEPFTYIRNGLVTSDFARMVQPLSGTFHFCLSNDNAVTSVQALVKVTAVVVKNTYGYKVSMQKKLVPRQEPYLKP